MYNLININEHAMTRGIELKNLDTNVTNICFDDSALKSDNHNFEFMKLNQEYMCRIELFGDTVTEMDKRVVECIVNRETKIGKVDYMEVFVNKETYYVDKSKVSQNIFFFKVSRKDIIQVNDVIHPDLL
jgi:hypothetical protein